MTGDHGGNIAKAARKYGLKKDEIIDFSANINFLGPPESVKKTIENNLEEIKNYPDSDYYELKTALVNKLPLETSNLIAGNGAVELIYLLTKVLNPAKALVLAPTFSEYSLAVKSIGGEVREYWLDQEQEFELEVDDLLSSLNDVDLFFLCNPNNPTGKYLTRSEIVRVVDYAQQQNTFVVVDEAFVDFTEEDLSVIKEVNNYDNLFVLRSLTKFFAIPGLRLGYGAGNKQLIHELNQSKDPWNVNFFAQLAGRKAIQDQHYIKRTKKVINREKKFLYQQLSRFSNLKVYCPTANYIFIDISNSRLNSSQLEEKLAWQGILIRNCNTYSGLKNNFIRVAVKNRKDNQRLIKTLENILTEID